MTVADIVGDEGMNRNEEEEEEEEDSDGWSLYHREGVRCDMTAVGDKVGCPVISVSGVNGCPRRME